MPYVYPGDMDICRGPTGSTGDYSFNPLLPFLMSTDLIVQVRDSLYLGNCALFLQVFFTLRKVLYNCLSVDYYKMRVIGLAPSTFTVTTFSVLHLLTPNHRR